MNEKNYTPKSYKGMDFVLFGLGAFVAGFVGSVFLLLIVFLFAPILEIQQNFSSGFSKSQSSLFPIIMSFLSFFTSLIVLLTTYYFFTLIDGEKYKKTVIHFGNICFLSLIIYIFIAPIYIWAGMIDYENILLVFVGHILILFFGSSFLVELLNNYRYILVGFYSSFGGFLLTSIFILALFFYFSTGFAKLLLLLFLLPLTNALFILIKMLFEFLYYLYYKITGYDSFGDIFYQIEEEISAESEKEI